MRSLLLLSLFLASPAPGASDLSEDFNQPNAPQPAFGPPGTLWDNDVNNSTSSLASQNGSSFARTVDDFVLGSQGCPSGNFRITRVRAQLVQDDSSPQSFAVDLFNDDGSGTRPDGFTPFATIAETTRTNLGPFGFFNSIFEAEFVPAAPIVLASGRYWLSAFGTGDNSSINIFFAASNGAPGEPDNGLIYAPNNGVPDWTPGGDVAALTPHFSFAIDGDCFLAEPEVAVPTLNAWGALILAAALAWAAARTLRASSRRKTHDA